MNRKSGLAVAFLLRASPDTQHVLAQSVPSPAALLRGAEMVRIKSQSIKASLQIQYLKPDPAVTIQGVVELSASKVRFEVLTGEVPGQVIIREGDKFLGYRREKNEDVHIYNMNRAIGVRGDVAFDPRVLGLSDLMTANLTGGDCLWYENNAELSTLGSEPVNGVNTWKVKATRAEFASTYWVEEPTFRVHKVVTEGQLGKGRHFKITIDSSYDKADAKSPFPSQAHAKRLLADGSTDLERIYTVREIQTDASIPADRFTLASMGLPINTAIVD